MQETHNKLLEKAREEEEAARRFIARRASAQKGNQDVKSALTIPAIQDQSHGRNSFHRASPTKNSPNTMLTSRQRRRQKKSFSELKEKGVFKKMLADF
jgi:hypothetical protein